MKIDSNETTVGWTKYKDLMGLIFVGEEINKYEDQNNKGNKGVQQTGDWQSIRRDYDPHYEMGNIFEIY